MKAVLQYVLRTLMKDKTGIVQTMPKKEMVDFNVAMTTERLMSNGFDPNAFKNADQVENAIKQIEAPRVDVISQGDPRFEGIMSKMTGSNVIKADFGKPFKEEIKKMKSDEEIVSNIKKSNARSGQNLRMQMMDDKVANDMFQGGPSRDPKTDADMLAEFIADDAGKIYDDLPTKERLKFYDRAYNAIMRYKRKDPKDMAQGGRIGLKAGMTRRAFMKLMGAAGAGIGALKSGILGLGKEAAPAVEAVKETVTQAPSYFFNLVNKIKMFGKEGTPIGPRQRTVNYKNYELTEDISTGDITIVKQKGDPDFAYEEEVMLLRRGQADETTKGRTPPDEYEELTVRPDMDGKMKDIEDGIEPEGIQEIIQEASGEAPSIKKAGGGIARMLGE